MTVYEMLEEAVDALAHLADVHHRTLEPSRLHDPERREWTDCGCRTCVRAAGIVKRFRNGEAARAVPDYARNDDGSYMTPEQTDGRAALGVEAPSAVREQEA